MGYAIAQLRKVNGENTYMQNISVTPVEFESPNKFESQSQQISNPFLDYGLSGNFEKGKTYYLRFIIHRIPEGFYSRRFQGQYYMYNTSDDMTFTLLLKNRNQKDQTINVPQVIDTFTVKSLTLSQTNIGANTIYYSYTTVFTPSRTCDLLGFRLTRTAYDVLTGERRDWLFGSKDKETIIAYDDNNNPFKVTTEGQRIIYSGEKGDIAKLNNIINNSDAGSKSDTWLKLGFQSRPGVLIVVNQQPIRVGRSGIYEINNGTSITSFMITAPQGSDNKKIDAFLLDYAYNS